VDLRGLVHEHLNCIHTALNRYRNVMKFVDVDMKIQVKFVKDEVKSFGAAWNKGS
jgi:hypothetical protein